jgi:Asp-tRNA(Asn)/Glu-tRNA(Gln) amidotransferase A subunit family amidase
VRAALALRRIRERRALNAFVFVDEGTSGNPVVAVKDNIDVRGMPMTAGGRHLPATPVERDAECVRRLRAAGWAIIGKTNLFEYAMGGTSENPHHGNVINPRAPVRDAGGSSSGSAAAVAAGLADVALGTDTLGSVRIPAAFCGIVGYKPARGAISRRGVFPNSSTLDTVGVLAADVRAAARAVEIMSAIRRGPGGGTRARRSSRPTRRAPLRLAVPSSWLGVASDEVREAFGRVAGELPDIALPPREVLCDVALTIAQFEGLRIHRVWLRTRPELYGDDLRAQLDANRAVTPARYARARRDLVRLRRQMHRALATVDAVLTPTVPMVPPLVSDRGSRERHGLSDFTRPFNVSDSATFTIPLPGTALPIGLQIASNDHATALRVALVLERRLRLRQ